MRTVPFDTRSSFFECGIAYASMGRRLGAFCRGRLCRPPRSTIERFRLTEVLSILEGCGRIISAPTITNRQTPISQTAAAGRGLCFPPFLPGENVVYLRQHRTMGAAGFGGSFGPIAQYEKWEIHLVFPHFSYFRLCQNTARISLPHYTVLP